MKTDRRGFLAALVLAPLGVKVAQAAEPMVAIDIEAPSLVADLGSYGKLWRHAQNYSMHPAVLSRLAPNFIAQSRQADLWAQRIWFSNIHDPESYDRGFDTEFLRRFYEGDTWKEEA